MEFADDGSVKSIRGLQRNDAHRLIEECMLVANVTAAEFLLENEIPAMFRNHDTPKVDKLENVRSYLGELGLSLGGGEEPTTKDYLRLIEQIKSREDAHIIQMILLRSMPLAVYEEVNTGHFGLAFEAYAHFTSPIRRYPDLLVHRAIRHLITKQKNYIYTNEQMRTMAEHCSMTERRAEEASRDVVQRMKCEYIQDKVGVSFSATVSSVTNFGLFVELDEIFVEGLVHITSLPVDYYHFDAVGHRLHGERHGRNYRLGNRVQVKLMRVDVDDKKIDFEIIE